MAYDEKLAQRIRDQVMDRPEVNEIKMFGGLCFTLRGNMFAGILGDNLMVRVRPDRNDEILAKPHTKEFDMTGRPMAGFILIDPEGAKTAAAIRKWLAIALEYVEPMPPKKPKPKRKPVEGAKVRAARSTRR